MCTFIYFATQNIFLRVLLCPTVSPALQLHYVTAMFGNINCATLCSSVVLHSAYITGHWYIYNWLGGGLGFVLFFQPNNSPAVFATNAVFITFQRATKKPAVNQINEMEIKAELIMRLFPLEGV